MYDSLKPVVLTGTLDGSFLASFLLGWGVTTGAGIASYPLGQFPILFFFSSHCQLTHVDIARHYPTTYDDDLW